VTVSTETFQRARRPEQKAQRREAILAAAADLARRDRVREVTLSDIARAVGIHKSALLRYFETREQIFLELTGRAWKTGARRRPRRWPRSPRAMPTVPPPRSPPASSNARSSAI